VPKKTEMIIKDILSLKKKALQCQKKQKWLLKI